MNEHKEYVVNSRGKVKKKKMQHKRLHIFLVLRFDLLPPESTYLAHRHIDTYSGCIVCMYVFCHIVWTCEQPGGLVPLLHLALETLVLALQHRRLRTDVGDFLIVRPVDAGRLAG